MYFGIAFRCLFWNSFFFSQKNQPCKNVRRLILDFSLLLGDVRNNLQVWSRPPGFKDTQIRDLSVECQFLLCLIILRRNKIYTECGYLFKVCPTIISVVFKMWLAFLRSKFKDFEPYCRVSRKDLKLPKAFKNKLLRDVG